MTTQTTRPTYPRRWNSLVLTTAALGLAPMADLAYAQVPVQDAQIWRVAEGGEGGEAGAVADASADVAYLAQLAIVEGHLRAARDLYAKGAVDEAIGLSYHPEAEMMDVVRETLVAHNAPDITPAMTAFSQRMEAGAPLAEVEAALTQVRAAISTATASDAGNLRLRFDAIVLLVKAAAHEYAESIAEGAVSDVMAYHESHAFVETAGLWLAELAKAEPAKAAAEKAIAVLAGAADAYGDMSGMELQARDPAILAAVAARVELTASQVR